MPDTKPPILFYRSTILSVAFWVVTGFFLHPAAFANRTVEWATYFGGEEVTQGHEVKTDRQGNVYIVGPTKSLNNIATAGAHQTILAGDQDLFLAKFSSDGHLLWATYLGGEDTEWDQRFAIDTLGNAYVAGTTRSTTNIATSGTHKSQISSSFADAFIMKFSPDGVQLWGTYFGGAGVEQLHGLSVDPEQNLIIAGRTSSAGIATAGALQPQLTDSSIAGFIAKFSASGALVWSTYYNGLAYITGDVTTDSHGNIYTAARARNNPNLVATPGAHQMLPGSDWDIFLIKLSPDGNLLWASFFGGENWEDIFTLATDSADNLYMAGFTRSNTGIATPGAFSATNKGADDGFLAKFTSAGQLSWATYFGGAEPERILDIEPGAGNSIFITGNTRSTSAIATAGAHQQQLNGISDGFIAEFSTSGNLEWATYFGGENSDVGLGLAVSAEVVYMAGRSQSTGFVATQGSHQPALAGSLNAILVKFATCTGQLPISLGADTTICEGETVLLQTGQPGASHIWSTGATGATIEVSTTGHYWVQAWEPGKCRISDTVSVQVIPIPDIYLGPDLIHCSDNPATLSATAPPAQYTYLWSTGASSPEITATEPGVYWVQLTQESCSATDTVFVSYADCNFHFPNVFTPNNDSHNQTFVISNSDNTALSFSWRLSVYNRWGQKVYSNDYYQNNWEGIGLADGIYYYLAENVELSRLFKGWVEILR